MRIDYKKLHFSLRKKKTIFFWGEEAERKVCSVSKYNYIIINHKDFDCAANHFHTVPGLRQQSLLDSNLHGVKACASDPKPAFHSDRCRNVTGIKSCAFKNSLERSTQRATCSVSRVICSVTSRVQTDIPWAPCSKAWNSAGTPARHNALYNLTEFSTGTQESSDVAQMKQGGADGRTLFSNE